MKLNELKNIISYDFDFSDTTIDATFYCELDSIQEKYAKQIEVKKIYKDYVVCDFTNFIQHHKTIIIFLGQVGYITDFLTKNQTTLALSLMTKHMLTLLKEI